jgi:FAD/FMN-containing dehydrogenase
VPAPDDLAAALVGIVGPAHVLVEPGMRAGYEVDWTGSHGGPSRAVVRPGSTAEVAAVLEACDRAGAAVVPQGGNTGLVGGGVPAGGEVVLSLRRLTSVGPVDPLAAQVTAGAGVVLADLQRVLVPSGLEPGVDLAAREGATVGGLVATNAGGLRVLRHGTMRAQVVGVEAVLAGGQVLSRLGGLAKDATGYDLGGLLVGSEGTLGVVTAARLRLVQRRPHRVAALLALPSVADAVSVAVALRDALDSLDTAELVVGPTLDLVDRERRIAAPSPRPRRRCCSSSAGAATTRRSRRWPARWRRAARRCSMPPCPPTRRPGPAVAPPGGDHRGAAVGRATAQARRQPAAAAASPPSPTRSSARGRPWRRAHLPPLRSRPRRQPARQRHRRATRSCRRGRRRGARLVAEGGGSIGAEHGIGRAKGRWLHLSRSPAELAAFRALKARPRPTGTLNPGVLLPPPLSRHRPPPRRPVAGAGHARGGRLRG